MNKKKRLLILNLILVLTASLLSGCSFSRTLYSDTFFAMDTFVSLSVYGNEKVLKEAHNLVQDLEGKLSVTDKESDVYKCNLNKTASISDDTLRLIKSALEICDSTDGALDLSIYPLVTAWGFTTEEKHVPSQKTIDELLPTVDYHNIQINEADGTVILSDNMSIDLGSVSKGYTGDCLVTLFKTSGVKSALINLGGNIQVIGNKPGGSLWKVAVSDPFDTTNVIGYLSVRDKAVVTSGSYQRFFEQDGRKYHHIIDPATGYPADNGLASVTIVGDSGLLCDGLSTALFVMGLDDGIDYWKKNNEFEVIWIDTDNKIYVSEGLEASLTPNVGHSVTYVHR